MILKYFQELAAGIEKKIEQTPNATNARKKYALEVARLGIKLYGGKETIAWCGPVAPFDILNAMDINPCFIEFAGAILSSLGVAGDFIEKAEQAGYPVDSCSYHKAVTGALYQKLLPVPDIIIGTSSPCIAGLSVMENVSGQYKKPFFILNIPQEDSKEGVNYLKNQIEDMVKFVQQHTGKTLDKERFRKSMELANQARDIMKNLYKLAKHVPSPANSSILKDFGLIIALLSGRQACIDVCSAFKEEFEEKVKSQKSGVPDENIRLLWIQNRIQFKNPIDKVLEEKYKASVVIDELNDITWKPIDYDDPYTSIAKRMISIPFCTSVDKRIKHLRRLCLRYKIDGAINPCHWGCRQGAGIRGLISKGLKEIDVPVLNLEVDCVDSRNFAQGQIMTRIEAFMEMLADKKKNKKNRW